MHAREWISPAVVMYTLKQLVENFKVNRKVVEGADWYILPVSNPDGYEYSHTTDRFWRKTRSNHESQDEETSRTLTNFFWGESCRGVDMNRNWNFHWGEVGASDDPCHETYAGPRPFSEPETRAISDFIMDRKDRIKLYLTMHAYSQMWLVPWGYTSKKTGDYDDLMNMGRKAVDALNRVSGTQYQLGPSPSLLYPTSGKDCRAPGCKIVSTGFRRVYHIPPKILKVAGVPSNLRHLQCLWNSLRESRLCFRLRIRSENYNLVEARRQIFSTD